MIYDDIKIILKLYKSLIDSKRAGIATTTPINTSGELFRQPTQLQPRAHSYTFQSHVDLQVPITPTLKLDLEVKYHVN